MSDILAIAKDHLRAIEQGKAGHELAPYYCQYVEQIEYPNRLNPVGTVSDYNTLLERSQKGKQFIVKQSFEVQREFVHASTVILEIIWRGVFNIPIGQTPAGSELKAFFAMFVEFENGKILRQRNYDCFQSF